MTSERMIMVPDWLVEEAASLIEQAGLVGTGVSLAAPRLRAALAQPAAGEPVAWMYDTPNNGRQYSDKRLDHYWWDAFKDSYVKGVPLYAAPPAAAHGALPSLAGICRVADHPHGVLLILRSSPTEDDLLAIQQALRGDAAAHGDEAVRKDAERYQALRDLTEGLDATVDAMIAEATAMRAQGDGGEA